MAKYISVTDSLKSGQLFRLVKHLGKDRKIKTFNAKEEGLKRHPFHEHKEKEDVL